MYLSTLSDVDFGAAIIQVNVWTCGLPRIWNSILMAKHIDLPNVLSITMSLKKISTQNIAIHNIASSMIP